MRLRLCFNRAMPAAFHPAVARWFARTFDAPTPAQSAAWPAIAAQRHVLIAAPTGSGKTLAAFLAVIDELVRIGVAAAGSLPVDSAGWRGTRNWAGPSRVPTVTGWAAVTVARVTVEPPALTGAFRFI